jgi:hypothetical protein
MHVSAFCPNAQIRVGGPENGNRILTAALSAAKTMQPL